MTQNLELRTNSTEENQNKHQHKHQNMHVENGLFVIKSIIRDGEKKFYCRIEEKTDKVRLYIKEKVNGEINEYNEVFATNGLEAKGKACAFYERIKNEFLKKN